jgi:molybdopterin-guanine dinucleotide biosynthesis protein B
MYLGFCGPSNSGKTTMICEIIKRANDLKIAVVKHTPHGIDLEGKDSAKFKEAGAEEVVLLNNESVHFRSGESLYGILKGLKNYDVILVEGFKEYKFLPKVCLGMECENCVLKDPNVEDVLSYIRREIAIERIQRELPNFNCGECNHRNCREMAEAIYRGEDEFKNCRYWNPHALISVKVNGKDIYMGKFAQDVVIKTITGLLSAFKGVDKIEEVEIKYKLKTK